jgi:hypothetical protein
MVPRLLSLLALLPLLLPPGLCVCHAPTAACSAGTPGHDDGVGLAFLGHLCLDHHSDGADHGGSHGHAPGCPAVMGHQTAMPDGAVQVAAPDLAALAIPLGAPTQVAAAPVFPHRLCSPHKPFPLFLSLRTLRI